MRHGIAAITEIDTRSLPRYLRDKGAQTGAIGSEPPHVLVERARSAPKMEGLDLVSRVTPAASYRFSEGNGIWATPFAERVRSSERRLSVVAMDFGAKRNILRCLVDSGCDVTAVPATTKASEILALIRRHLPLHGPGIRRRRYAVDTIKELLAKSQSSGSASATSCSAGARASTYKLNSATAASTSR